MHYHIKITQVKIHTDVYNTKEINKQENATICIQNMVKICLKCKGLCVFEY